MSFISGDFTFILKPKDLFELKKDRYRLKYTYSKYSKQINLNQAMMDNFDVIYYSKGTIGLVNGASIRNFPKLQELPVDNIPTDDFGISGNTIGFICVGIFVVIGALSIVSYYFYSKRRGTAVISNERLI
jgi:hypothetical protein